MDDFTILVLVIAVPLTFYVIWDGYRRGKRKHQHQH